MIRIALVLALAVGFAGTAAAKQVTKFQLGAWYGGAYTSDETGAFTSCLASASYNSGITMIVKVDREFVWEIGFSSNTWSFSPGEDIRLRFRIDKSRWENVTATAYSNTGVLVPMDGRAELVKRFRGGRTLELQDSQESFHFNLGGTSRLMVKLVRCTEQQLAREPSRQPNNNQVARTETPSVQPRTETPDRQNTQTARRADTKSGVKNKAVTNPYKNQKTTSDSDHLLVAEGTRVLSNFVANASLKDSQILSPADVPASLQFAHSVATAGGQVAFVFVVPREADLPQKTVTAAVVAKVSDGCEGSFLSGSAKSVVNDTKVSTGFAACEDGDQLTQMRYVVTPRGDGGIYLIGLIAGDSPEIGNGLQEVSPGDAVDDELLRQAAYRASR